MPTLIVKIKDLKLGDKIKTGTYESLNEEGENCTYPIYETVIGVRECGDEHVELYTDEFPQWDRWQGSMEITAVRKD